MGDRVGNELFPLTVRANGLPVTRSQVDSALYSHVAHNFIQTSDEVRARAVDAIMRVHPMLRAGDELVLDCHVRDQKMAMRLNGSPVGDVVPEAPPVFTKGLDGSNDQPSFK